MAAPVFVFQAAFVDLKNLSVAPATNVLPVILFDETLTMSIGTQLISH